MYRAGVVYCSVFTRPPPFMKMLTLLLACFSFLGQIYGSSVPLKTRAFPSFLPGTQLGHVNAVEEASGLCASRVNPNILYTHNDNGDGPKLYAISALTGELKKTIHVHGAHNYDWEDIACGPCDVNGGDCVYIGDIGDHSGDGARNIIYKIREPLITNSHGDVTVDVDAQIRFIWNPHQQDSETLMVDQHRNLYIISKVSDGQGKVGMIESSAWDTSTAIVTVSNLVTLPLSTGNNDPTGGDISQSGQEIIIQTHHQIFYWQVVDGIGIKETFIQNPIGVPFHYKKNVESVAWDANGRGYYTVAEGHHENLYYYARQ
ncbi:uncharacterized protein LOC110447263 [Mizuhopecten yessoensis]|uniref:Uncharacterized protein n=1 Tax=Mizuhopecten yessoensis TaxID=6573 RepID=A0A210QVP8_MIZYE|nr:uncharacterized protein LOC110447263 [Mizuhopecten yessoensis]OWF52811.1 hypothetical protein KP79_PYT21450 [Mizuhopecten yessoensis]